MIRLATDDDLGRLWPLARAYLDEQVELGSMPLYDQLAMLLRAAVGDGEAIVVAEEFGALVGFVAWAAPSGYPTGWALGLGTYVVPACRGRRIAAQMTEKAKEHCRSRGIKTVEGAVLSGNDAGMARALHSGADVVGVMIRWEL